MAQYSDLGYMGELGFGIVFYFTFKYTFAWSLCIVKMMVEIHEGINVSHVLQICMDNKKVQLVTY